MKQGAAFDTTSPERELERQSREQLEIARRKQRELYEAQLQQHSSTLEHQERQRRRIADGFGREVEQHAHVQAAMAPSMLQDLANSRPPPIPTDTNAYAARLVAIAQSAGSDPTNPLVPPLVAADDAWWGGWTWAANAQQIAKASPPRISQLRGVVNAAEMDAEMAMEAVEEVKRDAEASAKAAAEWAAAAVETAEAEVRAARAIAEAKLAHAAAVAQAAGAAETQALTAEKSAVKAANAANVTGYYQVPTSVVNQQALPLNPSGTRPMPDVVQGGVALEQTAALSEAERHAKEIRLSNVAAAEAELALRAEQAARLLASIAPSSAATAAAAALAEAETRTRLAAQAASAGADIVAERRQREAAQALADAEELARRAAQGAGREGVVLPPVNSRPPSRAARSSSPTEIATGSGEFIPLQRPSSPPLLAQHQEPSSFASAKGRASKESLQSEDGSVPPPPVVVAMQAAADAGDALAEARRLRAPPIVSKTEEEAASAAAAAQPQTSPEKPWQLRRTSVKKKSFAPQQKATKEASEPPASEPELASMLLGEARSIASGPLPGKILAAAEEAAAAPSSAPPPPLVVVEEEEEISNEPSTLLEAFEATRMPTQEKSPISKYSGANTSAWSRDDLRGGGAGGEGGGIRRKVGGLVGEELIHGPPLMSTLAVIKNTAAENALRKAGPPAPGKNIFAAAFAAVDSTADKALERSRQRAREAKERLAKAEEEAAHLALSPGRRAASPQGLEPPNWVQAGGQAWISGPYAGGHGTGAWGSMGVIDPPSPPHSPLTRAFVDQSMWGSFKAPIRDFPLG